MCELKEQIQQHTCHMFNEANICFAHIVQPGWAGAQGAPSAPRPLAKCAPSAQRPQAPRPNGRWVTQQPGLARPTRLSYPRQQAELLTRP